MTRYVALLRGLNSALAEDGLARELAQAIETAWRGAHGDLPVGRLLGVTGTNRNWNTVTRLAAMTT